MAKRQIKYFLDFHGLDRYDDIVREKIEEAISKVLQFHVVVIPEGGSLPEKGDPQTIYLLPAKDPSIGNYHEEYLWIVDDPSTEEGHWELIGTTKIDLSDYYTKEEIDASISAINDSINILDASIVILNSSINDALLNIIALDSSVKEAFVDISILTDYINVLNSSVDIVTDGISTLNASINKLYVDVSNKQDIIEDLDIIRLNASTALQPGDNITELINDASFIDASYIQEIEYVTALHITNLHDNVSTLYERMPTKTSQLINDSSFVSSEEISSVSDVSILVIAETPVIDKTSESGSSFNIDPNKMYMFGTKTSLTINLNPGKSDIVNEYMFQFNSGSTATTLNVPNTVVWIKDPNISTNKKYAVSIENNLGIIGEWNNE